MSKPSKWRISRCYGFAGTDSYEDVDIIEDNYITQEEFDNMTVEQIQEILTQDEWQAAVKQVEACAEPLED